MIYLRRFFFPDAEREVSFRMAEKRTCFDTHYPFQVLSGKGLSALEMDHLTILYGGNGSGKTTALNVIAEKLSLQRDTLYNRSNFFGDYLNLCHYDLGRPVPRQSRVITSDDVFDYMLNLRAINQGVDANREEIMADYLEMSNANAGNKYGTWQLGAMEDYETLTKLNAARHKTQSRFVRSFAAGNVREQSNGESAYAYFTDRIRENALYLLWMEYTRFGVLLAYPCVLSEPDREAMFFDTSANPMAEENNACFLARWEALDLPEKRDSLDIRSLKEKEFRELYRKYRSGSAG